jgi:hypothetical protein
MDRSWYMRPNYRSSKVDVQFARKKLLTSSFAHLNGVRQRELLNPYLTDRDYIFVANNDFHSRRWLDSHPSSRMLRISGSQFHLLKAFVYITSSYAFPLKAITFFNIFFYTSPVFIPLILSTLRFIPFLSSFIFIFWIHFVYNTFPAFICHCIFFLITIELCKRCFYRSWFFSVADVLASGLQPIH